MLNLKNLKLKNDLFLAPLAGVTDAPFRMLCKKQGAALTFTEMISANALSRKNNSTIKLAQTLEDENPIAIQLFGQNPDIFEKSLKLLPDLEKKNKTLFDIVDINFGCPSKNIISQGSGSALLARPNKVAEIVKVVRANTDKIVSCKIRTGLDNNNMNAVEIAKICQESGADFLTVHGRTQKQAYTGKANWDEIRKVKNALDIPVCGNGDVKSYSDYVSLKEKTKADFVMIGRASFGNPFIFKEINSKGKFKHTIQDKLDALSEYIDNATKIGIDYAIIKRQAQMFTKGIPKSTILRLKISKTNGLNGLYKIIKSIERTL